MNNIFKFLSRLTIVVIFSTAVPAFAGPTPTTGPLLCNSTGIGFLSTAALSLDSAGQNSAQFDFTGRAGDDVQCIYTMNIYVAATNTVSPTNFSIVKKSGDKKFVGIYNYSDQVVPGLNTATTYYAVGCVTGQTAVFKCSTPVQFTTQPAPVTNGGGGNNNGGGGGGGIYQLPPIVGLVTTSNPANNTIFASVTIQTIGCPALTWFEYGKGNYSQSTTHQSILATLQGTLSGTLSGLSGGSQYIVRAVAQNCKGIVYGPSSTFVAIGGHINTSTNNNNNSNTNTTGTYTNYSYNQRYNRSATNSTSHSRAGYWDRDYTDRSTIDENNYYYNSNTNRNVDTVINDNGSTGAYGSAENFQYVSNGYYRGNGGDLRVYDRPFDIVGASNYIRGGVARSYDTTYWAGTPSASIVLLVAVLLVVAVGYGLGRKTAR